MKTVEVMVRSARDFSLWLLVYIIVQVGSQSLLLKYPMGPIPTALIVISPVIPIAFIVRSVIQLLQHSDEFQQHIQLFSIGFASAATGLLTFAYGLLETIGYPPLNSALILPLMVFLWIIGMLYFKWRYK